MRGTRRASPRPLRAALLAVLFAVPLVFSVAAPAAPTRADQLGDAQAQQQQLQQRIKQQQADLASLKAAEAQLKAALSQTAQQLSAINANQAQLTTQIATATAALAVVQGHYQDLVGQLAHLDWTLGLLQDEQQQSEDALAARRRLLADRLAQAYQTQQTSLLEQLLSADSFTTVLSQVSDYLSQGDQDAALAAEIQQDQQALQVLQATTQAARFQTDQLRAAVAQQATEMQAQEAALKVAKHQLDLLAAQTKKLQAEQLAAYRAATKNQAQAAALLRREQAAESDLQRQIDALIAAQFQGGGIPSQYSGKFTWPLVGTISQEFGCTGFPAEPPLGNCAHFHRGIDIVGPYGARDPGGRRRHRRVRRLQPLRPARQPRLDRHHRARLQPADVVRPHAAAHPRRHLRRGAGQPGPGGGLGGLHRQLHRSAPALGGAPRRHLGEPAPVPVSAARRGVESRP